MVFGSSKVGDDGPKPHDPKFKGPVDWSERRTRDCTFVLLFAAFWFGLVTVAVLAFDKGDPYRFIFGSDSFGNSCGNPSNDRVYDNINSGLGMGSYKREFYFYPTESNALTLCVPACPAADNINSKTYHEFIPVDLSSGLCLNNDTVTTNGTTTGPYNAYHYDAFQATMPYSDTRGCPKQVWASTVLMNRCIPVSALATGAINGVMDTINAQGIVAGIMSDIEKSYESILLMMFASLVLSILMIILLRYIAYWVIWTAYWVLLIASTVLLGWLWWLYVDYKEDYDWYGDNNLTAPDSAKENVDMFLALAIVWSILGGALIILMLFMHSRIALVVALFQEAGDAIGKMPLLVFYPIITFVVGLGVIFYFMFVLLYLWTAGETRVDNVTQHVSFEKTEELVGWYWYHLFGFFWTFEFILAMQEIVVAGAVASWYFTMPCSKTGRRKIGGWPIFKSFLRAIRFSLGSVIAGALIIAIIKIVRYALSVFEERVLKLDPNSAVKFLICCVKCCLWCFEKCMKFLNRNAYIEIAITGKSFCSAAMAAFSMLVRNALRVAAINSIGDFVLFLAKLVIIIVTAIGTFLWFRNYDDGLQYEAIMICIVIIFSYCVATMFIGIYEMTIDTIFLCFCEDSERNDGSCDKPFFMSKRLMKFMSREERRTQKRTKKQMEKAERDYKKKQGTYNKASSLDIAQNDSATRSSNTEYSAEYGSYGSSTSQKSSTKTTKIDNSAGYSDV